DKITTLKIDGINISGVALAEKFNEYFVELLHSTHSEHATKYMISIHESLFLHPTDEDEVYSFFLDL
ncbi:MAG: hypothetical protein O7D30_03765, partial [Rickettsia endosymbiont of Ixodes persulcatus]|nr:hypothetical protein [Rickettsia endosymbiont of Ixodes persulcatus]